MFMLDTNFTAMLATISEHPRLHTVDIQELYIEKAAFSAGIKEFGVLLKDKCLNLE